MPRCNVQVAHRACLLVGNHCTVGRCRGGGRVLLHLLRRGGGQVFGEEGVEAGAPGTGAGPPYRQRPTICSGAAQARRLRPWQAPAAEGRRGVGGVHHPPVVKHLFRRYGRLRNACAGKATTISMRQADNCRLSSCWPIFPPWHVSLTDFTQVRHMSKQVQLNWSTKLERVLPTSIHNNS